VKKSVLERERLLIKWDGRLSKMIEIRKKFDYKIHFWQFVIFINLLIEARYIFSNYRSSFNSDSAAFDLFAQDIRKTHSLFPSNWYYANGDFFTFTPHLLMIPLQYLITNQYLIHAISVFLFYLLDVYLSYILLKSVFGQRRENLITLAVLTSFISISVKEFFYAEGADSGMYAVSILLFMLIMRIIPKSMDRATSSKPSRLCLDRNVMMMATIFSVALISNPIRFISWIAIPAIVVLFFNLWEEKRKIRSQYFMQNFTFILAVTIISFLFYVHNYQRSIVQNGVAGQTTLDFGNSWNGLSTLYNSICWVLGVSAGVGHKLFSIAVIAAFIHALISITSFKGISKIYKTEKFPSQKVSFLWYCLGLAAPSLFLVSFSGLGQDFTSGHYFLIPFTYLLIFGLNEFLIQSKPSYQSIVKLTVVGLSFCNVVQVVGAPRVDKSIEAAMFHELARYPNLAATYWNASKNQVLSNGKLTIQPVFWDNSTCFKGFAWLSTKEVASPKMASQSLLIFKGEEAQESNKSCNVLRIDHFTNFDIMVLK